MGSPQGSSRTDGGKAAFLRDLRTLRDRAGLDQAELAARAHYPVDTLRAAERGPVLPTLPVLEAYVRACGADPAEWEDRWRQLTSISPSTLLAPDAPPEGQRGGQPARTVLLSLGYLPRRQRTATILAAASVLAAAVAGVLWAGWPGSPAAHRGSRSAAPPVAAPSAPPGSSRPPSTSRPAARTTPRPARPAPTPSPARTGASLTGQSVPLTVAGVGCPNGPGHGFTLAGGPPGPGWTDTEGGWTGNGCDGAAVWSQNPPGGPGPGNSFTWFFRPAPGVSACTLAVFVPTMDANGLADYTVSGGPAGAAAPGPSLGTVPVDQATSAGQWVTLGRYPASGGTLFVQLTAAAAAPGPPGQAKQAGNGPGHNSAVAASAASAACS